MQLLGVLVIASWLLCSCWVFCGVVLRLLKLAMQLLGVLNGC